MAKPIAAKQPAVTFDTRRGAGQPEILGRWRGERDENNDIYKAYQYGVRAADEIQKIKSELKEEGRLTELGINDAVTKNANLFFSSKGRFNNLLKSKRKALESDIAKLSQLDNSFNDDPVQGLATIMQHDRLIRAWQSIPKAERDKMLAFEHGLQREGRESHLDPDLARALVTEPGIVTEVTDRQQAALTSQLIPRENADHIHAVQMELDNVLAAERSLDRAGNEVRAAAGLGLAAISEAEADGSAEPPATKEQEEPKPEKTGDAAIDLAHGHTVAIGE